MQQSASAKLRFYLSKSVDSGVAKSPKYFFKSAAIAGARAHGKYLLYSEAEPFRTQRPRVCVLFLTAWTLIERIFFIISVTMCRFSLPKHTAFYHKHHSFSLCRKTLKQPSILGNPPENFSTSSLFF